MSELTEKEVHYLEIRHQWEIDYEVVEWMKDCNDRGERQTLFDYVVEQMQSLS